MVRESGSFVGPELKGRYSDILFSVDVGEEGDGGLGAVVTSHP